MHLQRNLINQGALRNIITFHGSRPNFLAREMESLTDYQCEVHKCLNLPAMFMRNFRKTVCVFVYVCVFVFAQVCLYLIVNWCCAVVCVLSVSTCVAPILQCKHLGLHYIVFILITDGKQTFYFSKMCQRGAWQVRRVSGPRACPPSTVASSRRWTDRVAGLLPPARLVTTSVFTRAPLPECSGSTVPHWLAIQKLYSDSDILGKTAWRSLSRIWRPTGSVGRGPGTIYLNCMESADLIWLMKTRFFSAAIVLCRPARTLEFCFNDHDCFLNAGRVDLLHAKLLRYGC